MKVAFYDLEIGTDPKVVGWNNHKAMEFACGCFHLATYEEGEGGSWEVTSTSHSFLDASSYAKELNECDLVIGFNNIHFDDKVITAHAGNDQEFLLHRFDIFADLETRTGIRFITSLGKLAKTTIGKGKTKGISGEKVPEMWQAGKKEEVIKYCKQDCEVLFEVFEFGRKYGYVLLQPNKNEDLFGNMVLKIPVDWNEKIKKV